MKRIYCIFIAVLLIGVTVLPAAALEDEEPIAVASYYIPLLVESPEEGFFVEFLSEAAKRAGIEYKLELYPPKRAMRLFEDGNAMAIIPALLPTLSKDAVLTCTIFTKTIHGFVREGDTIPNKPSELEGKRIGLVRGFSYPRSIIYNENIKIDYADTTDGSLKKLEEGRIDVVVVDGHTAVRAIERLDLKGLVYDLSINLHSQPVFMAFQPTGKGEALALRMSKAILSMKEDGTYDALLLSIK